MNRIFQVMATFAVAFMVATMLLGFALRSTDIRDPENQEAQRWATVHRLSGIAAALGVVLVNCIVVVYFIGTSRWCKEVAEAYALDDAFTRRSNALKRRTFPLAVTNMLIVVGIVALGGATDPAGTFRAAPPPGMTWANLHFLAASLGIVAIGWASFRQSEHIQANHEVIEDVLVEVRRIRAERGLE